MDIPRLVNGMAELLQRTIGPTVEIRTSYPLVLSNALSDSNQLENALLNLVVNARDAMPDGGLIRIEARQCKIGDREVPELVAGEYICLSVTDEGVGMDAETLREATTPFYTTKGIGKGSGLGLPMVQGLMAQSGGCLRLKSTKGEGTIAELWLPVAPKVVEPVPTPAVEPSPAPAGRKLSILAVDDDALVLMNTVIMLEDLGHTVTEAHSAKDAIRLLKEGPIPDMVVTDHAMPQMTGAELAKFIQDEYPQVGVIVASGYGISNELDDEWPTKSLPLVRPCAF